MKLFPSIILIFCGTFSVATSAIDRNSNEQNSENKKEIVLPSIRIEGLEERNYTPNYKNQSDTIAQQYHMVVDSTAAAIQTWASVKNAQNNRE
ncbi:hypothetical protein GF407_07855 [candidate division KSB1 bacterium]|nr:hypothetical protein [candidate division KSB1 bacterium]